MVRASQERVLLIGDVDRQMYSTVTQAMPNAQVKSVTSLFDGIAELSIEHYTTVLAAVEPMERRPESAVRTLRELSGQGRLLLFGHPTLEPLSQKMMEFGCDDYLITPITPGELLETLGDPTARRAKKPVETASPLALSTQLAPPSDEKSPSASPLSRIPLSNLALDAMVQSPQDPIGTILRQVNSILPPTFNVFLTPAAAAAPQVADDLVVVSHRPGDPVNGNGLGPDLIPFPDSLHLSLPSDHDQAIALAFLSELAKNLAKLRFLYDRHAGLQRLAITDDLTGLANGRYFRQFLTKIVEKARIKRFLVTLFLFDIDNFKRYNDQYGHGVGDEILKQTANLMRRCVRDHDLVSRISGDEFAVVFWDKEGPRTPREPRPGSTNRTPQEPQDILDRFRNLLSSQNFPGLGPGGKGSLTISGGLAVYPYDAQDVNHLIQAADQQLMFGAKRSGRNSIHLVGGDCLPPINPAPESQHPV
ncbi:MAG: GGDEF domain-containing protein [Tepidisphaeraceae bacterium]|jgi:GGDEF domain-containing protein